MTTTVSALMRPASVKRPSRRASGLGTYAFGDFSMYPNPRFVTIIGSAAPSSILRRR